MAGDKGLADDPLLIDYIRARSLPRRGVMARTEQILVTLGAQNALYVVAQLLCNRGAKVFIEDPTYPDLRATLLALGADITTLPVDEHGMPVDARLAEADVVFVTPSHHAPTTATMPLARRRALLEAAEKYNFVIVEDDYDFEMGFLQRPAPALKSLDPTGRVVYIGSFSKSLFPGLRLGYLVAPDPVIREARALRSLVLRHPPGHTQRTAAYFLALGHHDALIRRLCSAFSERRIAMQGALESAGLGGARAPQFGGANFWIAAPEKVDTQVLAERLRARSVLIEPGAPFFASEEISGSRPPKNFMRLAYSSIASEKIPEGVSIVADEITQMCR
jgi:GntR family transcriptional regulator/MocR family aminotransferase